MNRVKNLTQNQEEKEESNVTDLKLIRSGLDSVPPEGNWLLSIPLHSDFIVRTKADRNNFMLLNLCLMAKSPRRVVLWENLNNKLFGEVDPERFIKYFEFVEIVKDEAPLIDTENEQE